MSDRALEFISANAHLAFVLAWIFTVASGTCAANRELVGEEFARRCRKVAYVSLGILIISMVVSVNSCAEQNLRREAAREGNAASAPAERAEGDE
jgi:hypothetical protein